MGVIAAAENTRPLQASAQETPLRQPPVEVIRIDDDDDDEDDDFMPRPSTVAPPPILQQSALKRPRPPSTETVQCELVRPDATPVFTHDDEQHNENMFDYEAAYGDHFDMDQWLPAVVSSPDRVRAPSPEPKRRLVYLEDIAAGCGSPGDVVFVKVGLAMCMRCSRFDCALN